MSPIHAPALPKGLTLGRALTLALAGLALVVGLLLGLLLQRWGDSLLAASERLRETLSGRAEAEVERTLGGAEAALEEVVLQARSGAVDVEDPLSVEAGLFTDLMANADLAEVTLTRAGRAPDDTKAPLAAEGRWQVSVFREGREPSRIVTSHTHQRGPGFVVDIRARPPGSHGLRAVPFARAAAPGEDPTTHPTFATTLEHHRYSSEPLWTDLHYAELDARLPEASRRVVVTVMKVLEDDAGRFLGVIRVGLLTAALDRVARLRVDANDPADPHRVFLADAEGRLITRIHSDQTFEDHDGDLRAKADGLPEEMRAALAHPALLRVSSVDPVGFGRFEIGGRPFLVSTLNLRGAQGWRVGIVVPEDHYLGAFRRIRAVLLLVSLSAGGVLLFLGILALRSVRGSLARMVGSAARMREFDFAPAPATSPFRDLAEVMTDLEQAKTALRAMGKYVPIDLVRQLYRARKEPTLGGELRDVSLMFTDIQDFTSLSESLPPDALAAALGRYFAVMTAAIHGSGGTVDKYIGDAVMALWNAPEAQKDHAALACSAALACVEATERLMRSPDWAELPPFRTRFGLHRDKVMVGHFGAPDRLSYTALGDGVNLASRLEGLNKTYGTTILASQAIRASAGDAFAFRLLDVVAVKGKSQGVQVYELIGAGPGAAVQQERMKAYERALEAYQQRKFADALNLLAGQGDDPPSRVLGERCRRFQRTPPPEDWNGLFVADSK
ncbi:MAG TPA: adenylate/guanylate cyclase domain-containing protein [Vicinamibacteria bacterium]|nr:adenylate/guanylate cyclase domain-containing protein [Vicinamibacteria bacterium]